MTIATTPHSHLGGAVDLKNLLPNRYGHFSPDGREYQITDWRTPRPWVNIIGNTRQGLAVSQTGSGFSWIDNSQLGVITRWQQEFVQDSSGKFLYVRDADKKDVWSLAPAPCWPAYDEFLCRHGLGYTVFETTIKGINAKWTLWVDPVTTAELWLVELKNLSDGPRRLELCGALEWNCGVAPSPRREFHKLFLETHYDLDRRAIIARNHMWEVNHKKYGHWNRPWPFVAAFSATEPVQAAQGDKAEFAGRYRGMDKPAALEANNWQPRFGRHQDPIGALRCEVELRGGESRTMGFVIAAADDDDALANVLKQFESCDAIANSLESVKQDWAERLSEHRIETPDPSIDLLTNDWLRYQAIVGRMWGRGGYYQQSGAYGFRDQLQDSQVWLTIDPEKCREQINLHASHQFKDGSVYHWWHPLSEDGLITTMTDDLLWLAFVSANYIRETGDVSILCDETPFLDDKNPATLREHVFRAFERVFRRTSPRGLPYIGAGDWNDGLSAAGLQEKGESIWLGHFFAGILGDWAHILTSLGEQDEANVLRQRRAKLVAAINEHGWDGEWYSRATLDDGSKLGSAECDAGKIFLNAQTWAILNNIADAPRAEQCWKAVCENLVSEAGALLLAPAFTKPAEQIGYITRYAPGLRENGGVYTHAATWAIAAAAKMRDHETLGQLLTAINPTNKDPERYWAEPYVTPGNVDGPLSPNFGRGGWTWYTGSAAWLHRVICEWVLGVRPTWEGLLVDPCMPKGWTTAKITRPYRGNVYDIQIDVTNQNGKQAKLTLDGKEISGNVIPPTKVTGQRHQVKLQYV